MPGFGFDIFKYKVAISRGLALDPDAQAFITAASITDPTQQSAVNQLVVDLKAASLWTKMKAVYPFVGGSASSHKWNLKDPRDLDAAFRLSFAGGVTHSTNGVTFTTNGYANTKWSVTAGNLYNRSYGEYLRDVTNASSTGWTGVFDGTNVFGIQLAKVGSDVYYATGLNNLTSTAGPIVKGLESVTVTSGANASKFYSTDIVISSVTANSTPTSGEFYIGGLNSGGSAILYSDKNIAFSYLADFLNGTEITALNTAVQTFQTALGRSIGTQTVSDSDAQAFVTAADIQDQVEAEAVNQLVVDLKAASLWTKMKAVYPFVGGSASSHKWNLKDPRDLDAAFRLTFSGGWTHNSNGAKANGSNASALTHFVHNAQLPDYKISFGTVRDQYTNGMIMGADSFRHYEWIGAAITMGTTVGSLYGGEISNGRVIMSRSASNNFQYFANGIKTTCANNVNGAATTQFELASFLGLYADARYKFCFIGENLNDTEASDLDTAMNAFNTTLGR